VADIAMIPNRSDLNTDFTGNDLILQLNNINGIARGTLIEVIKSWMGARVEEIFSNGKMTKFPKINPIIYKRSISPICPRNLYFLQRWMTNAGISRNDAVAKMAMSIFISVQ
jgi:hypothetical protein